MNTLARLFTAMIILILLFIAAGIPLFFERGIKL